MPRAAVRGQDREWRQREDIAADGEGLLLEADPADEHVPEDAPVSGRGHQRQLGNEVGPAADGVDQLGLVWTPKRLAMQVVDLVEVERLLRPDGPGRRGDLVELRCRHGCDSSRLRAIRLM